MSLSVEAVAVAKKYTDNSIKGISGTLAGKNCTIKSIQKVDGVSTITFEWTADDGTVKTSTMNVMDGAKGDIGIGIDNVTINTNSHLIVTLSDGSTIDAGLIQGGSGTDDYEDLINRPKIEGVDLIGNKTFEDLGVASATDLAQTDGHLQDLADLVGDKANLPMPNETVVNNIEYVDTKVDGLIDDNATGLTKTFSSDKIAKTFATLEEVNERIPQYEIMPTATESCGGQVVQFIGTSTSDYTHGYFYECVPQGSGYIWKNIGVQAIPVNLSELTNDSGYITVNVDNLVNYYLKTETYSQAEVDEIIGKLNRLTTEIVTVLPTENISTTTIYLIKVGETNNYTQHMYIGDAWADLGSTTIDLSGYVSKQQLTTTLADYVKSTDLQAHVDNNTVHLTIEDRDNLTNLLLDEHNHGNKKILDGILQAQVDNWNEAFTDKHTHDNKIVLDGITSTKVSDWDSAKTHADSAHAPSNAQENVLETVKVNGTALTPSDKAVNIDLSDYAKTADIPTTLPANGGNSDTVNGHTVNSDVPENAKFTDTTYSDATQIEHGLMSVDDKKKLDGLKKYTPDGTTITADEDGTLHGVKVTVDDALSDTSTNPVQNKVIKAYVDKNDSENVDFSTSTSKLLNGTVEAPLVLSNATRNLLNPDLQTTTRDGITCTNNGDGTYTLNGTATAETAFALVNTRTELYKRIVGKNILFLNGGHKWKSEYRILFNVSNSDFTKWGTEKYDGDSFVVPSGYEKAVVDIHVENGVTINNLVVKPMITFDLNATNDDFVPYSGYDVKTCGKNIVQNTLTNETINGITSVLNPDCSISFNGTASAVAIFAFAPKALKTFWNNCKGDVKLLGCPTDSPGTSSHYLQIWTPNGKTFVDDGKGIVIKESDRVGIPFGNIAIIINAGRTMSNIVFKPMLTTNLDATYDDYERYTESTVHIDSTTEFPLLGLKSFNNETNIISPSNVEVAYAKSDSGAAILDMLENKLDKDNVANNQNTTVEGYALDARQANPNIDGTLAKQISDLNGIRKETTVNLLKPDLKTHTDYGITCTANGDGTYTLNGTPSITDEHFGWRLVRNFQKNIYGGCLFTGAPLTADGYRLYVGYFDDNDTWKAEKFVGSEGIVIDGSYPRISFEIVLDKGASPANNLLFKPMLTTNLSATYDDFVPYTGDGETLASDVAEIKNDLGGLSFSASGTTLSITDGTNTWTLKANS